MRKQLFIQLPEHVVTGGNAAALHASWVLRDDERPAGALFHGNLQEAAAQAAGARVSVLVPGVDVLLAQVELPAMKTQRMAKAVPFALEEQLIEDVDDLHVAVGQRDKQGRVANAVVSRTQLDAWLAQLKAAGLHADVMTPEMFGLQWDVSDAPEANVWSMLIDGQAGLLRTGAQTGLAFDVDNLLPVLQACVDDAGDVPPSSVRISICGDTAFANSDGYHALSALCAEQGIDLSLDEQKEARSVRLAQGFDEQQAINLLQGDYSRKQQLEKLLRPWKPALILAAVWLVFQVGMFVVEYSRLSSQGSELKEQIETVYHEAFPQSHNIVNPKVQMQRGLEKLRGGGGQNGGLLPLLAKTGAVLKETPGASLRTLRFSNKGKGNKLDVDVNMPDLQSLDKLKQRLTDEAKLKVEIVSASSRDGKVESRLSLLAVGGEK